MNAEGNCKTVEWFNGYAHGALAANQCGANGYSSIPISPSFNGGIPPGAEHHIQYPMQNSSTADYHSLNQPVSEGMVELPTNSEISIPPVPVHAKPYE
jgi:hypothetical protein